MSKKSEQTLAVDDAGFVEFLEEETCSELSASTFSLNWTGLQAAVWEQGDDAFVSPPLDVHFLSIVLSGRALADIRMGSLAGSRFSMAKDGALCFMPAGDSADLCIAGRFETAHVMLSPRVVDAILAEKCSGDPTRASWRGFHGRTHDGIEASMRAIVAEFQGGGGRDPLVADRLGIDLARHLIGYACDLAPGRGDAGGVKHDLTPLQFTHAIDYIEARLSHDFGLDEIAAYVGVDPLRLSAGFKAEAGVSVDHFRTERRLDTVREWVDGSATEVPDCAIAKQIGFASVGALDAAFRAHVGVSFTNYREGRLS